MMADPINLMDASPMGDGAAAVVLVPAERLRGLGTRNHHAWWVRPPPPIRSPSITARDPLWLSAAESHPREAYARRACSPEDIDLFEAHDAFTIMAALSLEACGFAERGQGPRLAHGRRDPPDRAHSRSPPRGGLKARGHPVGATGMYQIVEVVQQLRGEAGGTQVQDARVGMAQNIGGSGSNILTHILRVED